MVKANILSIPFVLVITSFFFFPTIFSFFPIANTKMVVAACGLVTFLARLGMGGTAQMNKDFFLLSLCALGVGLASLLTMTINNTPDNSYLTYIVSMWVWLGGAYFVVAIIKSIHGTVSVERICFYLIAVGVLQCILAETMDHSPSLKESIDSVLVDDGFMGRGRGRTHGIGCALDVGGGRLAALLIMISYLLPRVQGRKYGTALTAVLVFSFFIIVVVGNAIGRTTTIGMVMAMAYLIYALTIGKVVTGTHRKYLLVWFLGGGFFIASIAVYLYNTSSFWHDQFRFAFEGFFSLAEKGRWEVTSNEMLKEGFIYPDNLRCWLIGDGYISSTDIDPYYTGRAWHGFYKGVDAGYSRFLFYFGLTGLVAFSVVMLKGGEICIRRFRSYWLLFVLLVALNFVVWVKATTDMFLVLAPFLILSREDEAAYNQQLLKSDA